MRTFCALMTRYLYFKALKQNTKFVSDKGLSRGIEKLSINCQMSIRQSLNTISTVNNILIVRMVFI